MLGPDGKVRPVWQHFVDRLKRMDAAELEGAKFVCSPPPRDKESQEACWEGLQSGTFELFSSDHCPFRYDDDSGKLNEKGKRHFRWIPNGIPGVETRLPILFSEGVSKGRIDINRFVALSSTNHAKQYGLYPQKGTIAIGSDADIALWDPQKQVTITNDILHHGADYTPYDGLDVRGWPVRVLLRGKTIVDKFPLHMARMPIIHRLFPDAKVVFVERHPCDVVLSCFMANFQLNRAMANMTTLEDAARLYDAAQQAWTRATELLPIEVKRIRYEAMIDDLETEMRALLVFLGLEWDANVLDNRGIHLDTMRVRAFPFPDEVIDFVLSHDAVFVIEQNRDAQLRTLLMAEGAIEPTRLISVLHYDGTPITARFIVDEISRRWTVLSGGPQWEAAE